MVSLLAVTAEFGGGKLAVRRSLKLRYQEFYASEQPEFQDTAVIPGLGSTGSTM